MRDDCTRLAARRVGGLDQAPLLIRRVEPNVRGIDGMVIIETIIDADGNVCDGAVLKGINPEVDAACLAAVKQWLFRPARANGHAVAVYFDLTVTLRAGSPPDRRHDEYQRGEDRDHDDVESRTDAALSDQLVVAARSRRVRGASLSPQSSCYPLAHDVPPHSPGERVAPQRARLVSLARLKSFPSR